MEANKTITSKNQETDMNINPYDDPTFCEDEMAGEAQYEARQVASADFGGHHHPDCQCNVCYYGEDLERWAFHASEY